MRNDGVPKNLDLLQNIEEAVKMIYHRNAEMKDSHVRKCFEVLTNYYKAQVTGRSYTFPPLGELEQEILENINAILSLRDKFRTKDAPKRKRFSRAFKTEETEDEKRLAAFRRLSKSLKLWNGERGVRGYLDYISSF